MSVSASKAPDSRSRIQVAEAAYRAAYGRKRTALEQRRRAYRRLAVATTSAARAKAQEAIEAARKRLAEAERDFDAARTNRYLEQRSAYRLRLANTLIEMGLVKPAEG